MNSDKRIANRKGVAKKVLAVLYLFVGSISTSCDTNDMPCQGETYFQFKNDLSHLNQQEISFVRYIDNWPKDTFHFILTDVDSGIVKASGNSRVDNACIHFYDRKSYEYVDEVKKCTLSLAVNATQYPCLELTLLFQSKREENWQTDFNGTLHDENQEYGTGSFWGNPEQTLVFGFNESISMFSNARLKERFERIP